MHLSMSSRWRGRRGIGQDFDRSLWPGGRGFELSCCPGGRDIFEFLLVPVTTNHFPGWGIQLYLTSHFCLGVGNLTAIFLKMSKFRPMPRLPSCRLNIDRCISDGEWCSHSDVQNKENYSRHCCLPLFAFKRKCIMKKIFSLGIKSCMICPHLLEMKGDLQRLISFSY